MRSRGGFSLLEVVIATSLSAVVTLGAMSMLRYFQKGATAAGSIGRGATELMEIRNLIQSTFRSRISLGTGMTSALFGGYLPWDLNINFAPLPVAVPGPGGFTSAWGAPISATQCYDLRVRRHRPIALANRAGAVTGVEWIYFVTNCTQTKVTSGNKLFTVGLQSDVDRCPAGGTQFLAISRTYFGSPENDSPPTPPIPANIDRITTFPPVGTQGRNIAVCFRPDPPGTLPNLPNLPPYLANGAPNPVYPRNLYVEIRAQYFDGNEISNGHYVTALEKFYIPIPNSNIEFIPPAGAP